MVLARQFAEVTDRLPVRSGLCGRGHVHTRRNRFGPADTARTAEVTEQFLTAATTGDLEGLLAILAPDVTWTTTAAARSRAVAHRRPAGRRDRASGVRDRAAWIESAPSGRIQHTCRNPIGQKPHPTAGIGVVAMRA